MKNVDKLVFFAFKGELMCFSHVLLNALDLHAQGKEVKIVMEGEATKLIKELAESNNPLYRQAREKNLIDSICRACSAKMGVLDYNEKSGIPLADELKGHPSMSKYTNEGFMVITL